MKGKRGIAAASTLGGLTAATPGAGALASSLGERSSKGVGRCERGVDAGETENYEDGAEKH